MNLTMFKINKTSVAISGLLCLGMNGAALADHEKFVLQGDCAQLPADRTTEFHGNPATSNLNLAMAGNQ